MLTNLQVVPITLLHQSSGWNQNQGSTGYKGHNEGQNFKSTIVRETFQIKPNEDSSQHNLYHHEDENHGCQSVTIGSQIVGSEVVEKTSGGFQCL